jgi:hypothetical protein
MRWVYISLILIAAACKETQPRPEVTEVYGYYVAGLDTAFVTVRKISEEKGETPVQEADVRLVNGERALSLSEINRGEYNRKFPDQWAVEGETIILEVDGEVQCISEAKIPPHIMPTFVAPTTFSINPSNPGASVFSLKWEAISGFSYLLSLQNIESNPTVIPFGVPAGLFQDQFFAPIEENETTLFDTDFKYYGRHLLTVYVIEDLYKDFFFFRNRGQGFLATQGPDNIMGARGLWTCVNAYQIELEILD